jgi:hypothetical protein
MKVLFIISPLIASGYEEVEPTTVAVTGAPIQEFINPHDFNMLINPGEKLCDTGGIFLLVYVHSAPSNYKKRLTIRQTWANTELIKDLKIVFMLGMSQSSEVNDLVQLESAIYGDMVQEDFVDTYRNLTYKGVMALKWIGRYCNRAQYVLKVDDDIVVNTFLLERHLKLLRAKNYHTKNTIFCYMYSKMKVIRNKRSKWYVTKEG